MARALLLASVLLLATIAGSAAAVVHETMNDAIVAEKLGTFSAIAQFVGAGDELKQKGATVTVFAPTDAALDAFAVSMGFKKASDLLKPQFIPMLRYVLANHITFKPFKAADLKEGQKIDVMSDRQLTVTKKDGAVFLDGAKVGNADVTTQDGTLHVVDSVIKPPNVYKDVKAAFAANPDWSLFAKAVGTFAPEVFKAAADPSTAGTIFVPDNKAMTKFLEQTNSTLDSIKANKNLTREALATLSYHIVPGLAIDAPSLTDERVLSTALVVDKKPRRVIVERRTSADGKEAIKLVGDLGDAYLFKDKSEVYAGAETLFTVDDVLVPSLEGGAAGTSVMDVLKAQGLTDFAKMLELLKVDDEFHNVNFNGAVLAPTNEAITAYAKTMGRTPASLVDRPGLLRELAGFHIVPDLSAQASKIAEAGTLVLPSVAGDNVTFTTTKGAKSLKVKGFHGAEATLLDEYTAGRGKVYKIDKVLLPADVWPTCYEALEAFADAKKTGGKLSSLKKAVDATPSVKKALQDPAFTGTIFAPGDEAFAALPQAAKDVLAGPNGKKTLESVLLYHVLPVSYSVPYKWPAKVTDSDTLLKGNKVTLSRTTGAEAKTSLGGTTTYQIVVTPEKGSVGKAALGAEYNLFCGNAVLHAIDQVLIPKL